MCKRLYNNQPIPGSTEGSLADHWTIVNPTDRRGSESHRLCNKVKHSPTLLATIGTCECAASGPLYSKQNTTSLALPSSVLAGMKLRPSSNKIHVWHGFSPLKSLIGSNSTYDCDIPVCSFWNWKSLDISVGRPEKLYPLPGRMWGVEWAGEKYRRNALLHWIKGLWMTLIIH